MAGPGGYYNIGNAIGLLGGLALAAWNAGGSGEAATAAAGYLAGSGSAVALTVATLVFFWSGEVYHRAWADPDRPDARLNRQGDLLSAIGAVALGISLALLGMPLLAATAGLMHALGKFGSALHRPGAPPPFGWPTAWPDLFRSVVLLSRVPATLAAALALAAGVAGAGPEVIVPALLGPGVLLLCNLLWARADLLLFRPAG
ncbi:hypothetical protein [Rubellimicrobium roseum]|uniref:Uncharacterized protein n=1 Tax=Rubellimicrobium roseum TaxID=687525 RepID=A0A5C4N561_9RHOB|nr:hypothetical protein [Rubellimicrobium roseum]TNC64006.1 hypothetical protein FHG71_18900 [Rubellimicrobium roseum]